MPGKPIKINISSCQGGVPEGHPFFDANKIVFLEQQFINSKGCFV
jgi:hypothetical protein